MNEHCQGCGGGLDNDPTLCIACRYERAFPGRSYEQDVDKAQKLGISFGQYVLRVAEYQKHSRRAERARAALETR